MDLQLLSMITFPIISASSAYKVDEVAQSHNRLNFQCVERGRNEFHVGRGRLESLLSPVRLDGDGSDGRFRA